MTAAPTRAPTAPPKAGKTGISFAPISTTAGHRICIYGPGGIGKTCMSMLAPAPIAIFDLDESLGKLGSHPKHVNRLADECCANWQAIRNTLQAPGWDEIKTIVIDTVTKAEEMAAAYTLSTVMHEKTGQRVANIEGYGFGKGYTHIYDTFMPLLADLDMHIRAGRNVILVAHDCTTPVPNPMGEDWLRYEPRLQSPSSGKSSIRLRLREWCDHLLFIGYDINVKDGKAKGSGSRTCYPTETPFCMAKSRRLADPMVVQQGSAAVWDTLFAK